MADTKTKPVDEAPDIPCHLSGCQTSTRPTCNCSCRGAEPRYTGMSEAITTGVFGTLILAALVYLGSRIDRLEHRIDRLDERLTSEIHGQGERLARIEGKLDEHLRIHPADSG